MFTAIEIMNQTSTSEPTSKRETKSPRCAPSERRFNLCTIADGCSVMSSSFKICNRKKSPEYPELRFAKLIKIT